MPAKSPRAAVEEFLQDLRRCASCITDRPLILIGSHAHDRPLRVAFAPVQAPVILRGEQGTRKALFLAVIDVRVVSANEGRGYEATDVAYRYHILNRHEREMIAFHWHPKSASPIIFPHVHVSGSADEFDIGEHAKSVRIADLHIPTRHLHLADVVRFVITELDAVPRRADWDDVLRTVTPED